MILGLGGYVEPWAAQALPLGAAFPALHPCWKAGLLAMFSKAEEVWIFMYNLLILMLATNSFPKKKPKNKKTVETKSPQQHAGISLQSLQVFISFLELGGQWGQRGI